MEPEQEFVESLQNLLVAMKDLHIATLETRNTLEEIVNGSHLKSLMKLQNEDIHFRRLMDIQTKP